MRRHILLAISGLLISMAPVFAQGAKPGVDVVPSTAFAFVTVRVSDLRDVEALKPVREAIGKLDKSERGTERFFGAPIDEVDRLTMFWPAVPRHGEAPYIPVTTKNNYNEARALKALQAVPPEQFRNGSGPDGAGAVAPVPAKAIDFGPPGSAVPVPKTKPPFPLPSSPKPKDFGPPVGPPKAVHEQGTLVGERPAATKQPARGDGAGDEAPAGGPDLCFRQGGDYVAVFLLDNRTLLHIPAFGNRPEGVLSLIGQLLRRKADGPLADALSEAGKHTVVAAAQVQPVGEIVREKGDLPRELVPFRSLLKARSAMLTADVAAKTTVVAKLTFADAATARRAEPVLKTLIQTGVDALADVRKRSAGDAEWRAVMDPLIDLATSSLEKADVKANGAIVSARVDAEIGPAIAKAISALPALMEVSSTKMKTLNNLKQIGLACYNYHDTYNYFPQNMVGPDGKAIFSWRVAILPFIEQDNMYRQLDLTKPWDDPRNAKVLAKMPAFFRVYGRDAEKGKTYLQMPFSPQPIPGGNPFQVAARRTTFPSITDGTSNTIMVVEAADAVDWAKPDDLVFDPKTAPKVGAPGRSWFFAGFADGSVQTLPRDKLTDDQLRALMTIDGGEVVEIPGR